MFGLAFKAGADERKLSIGRVTQKQGHWRALKPIQPLVQRRPQMLQASAWRTNTSGPQALILESDTPDAASASRCLAKEKNPKILV